MKVVAILENKITAGGGFSQALNAIVQMARLSEGRFDFAVLTSKRENLLVLAQFGITGGMFRPSILDKLIAGLAANELTRRLQARLRLLGPLERKLMRMGCNLVYFVAPSARLASLQRLNYIATVWDNCHRDFPEFPEVRVYGEFQRREFICKNYLSSAFLIMVDSQELRDRIHDRYGVDKSRMLAMPFVPNLFLENAGPKKTSDVLASYGLLPGYFFYPAQFWAHKNHIRILQALMLLRERGTHTQVVFVGGDQGNLGRVKYMVEHYELSGQVKILGFLPSEHMKAIFDGCLAVVMPTYFGPTNIPPLEAWLMRKPLIYSRHLEEQVGDAAILVDPDKADDLADAMAQVFMVDSLPPLIANGERLLSEVMTNRKEAESKFVAALIAYSARCETWTSA